jgi:hypothetical protein
MLLPNRGFRAIDGLPSAVERRGYRRQREQTAFAQSVRLPNTISHSRVSNRGPPNKALWLTSSLR